MFIIKFNKRSWQNNLELQIRGNIEHNLKIIFLITQKKHYVVIRHYNPLIETVLMMGNNIGFYGYVDTYP